MIQRDVDCHAVIEWEQDADIFPYTVVASSGKFCKGHPVRDFKASISETDRLWLHRPSRQNRLL